ncbi:Serine/threonine kinase-like domain-containing protein STKLD1 [Taenia solium]|eukprot:TsM_000143500 transcript=TsM_000143500 gene=TsM_000143500
MGRGYPPDQYNMATQERYDHQINLRRFLPLDENVKWLPPEAKDCGHVSDKSDAWSLGCLIFNLMYCGFSNESDLTTAMNMIRGSGGISHETMEVLKKVYPEALIELVEGMIATDANSRTGIKEASQNDYVKSVMDRYDVQRKLRRQRLERQLCECNIPYEHGLSTMLHYLVDQLEHENCVEGVLSWIAETQCCNEASTHPLLPLHVWRIFLVHHENPAIVQHGLAILAHCTSVGEMRLQAARAVAVDGGVEDPTSAEFYDTLIDNSTCWNETSLALVSKLAKCHVDSIQVHVNVLVLLEAILCPLELSNVELESQLAYWSKCRVIMRKVCEMDYPEMITKALMRVHMGHANILRIALAVLWKLSIDHVNARRFIAMDAFKLVYDAMFYFPKHPGIINQGALCLAALVSQRTLKEETITSVDIVPLLLNSIHAFCFFSDICYNLFYAVSAIINRSAELVLRFVQPRLKDCRRGLVALMFKAYSTHRDDNRVLGILVGILQVVMANG